ncbi:MAG: hypothetical protein LIP01_09205 [Tannerellaceae bacterium]|nr:hypothetical protein [Tannerellaceae bacterium]
MKEKEELLDQHHTKLEKRHQMLLLDLIDEMKRTKEKYAVKRAKSNFQERMEIDRTIYYEVLLLGDEKGFMIKMNNILNRFPDKLKEAYPAVTYKEIIWCCLFLLRIPTNDMCIILEYKQTSLYKFKQRLMKKLGFNTAKEFEEMLYELMNT